MADLNLTELRAEWESKPKTVEVSGELFTLPAFLSVDDFGAIGNLVAADDGDGALKRLGMSAKDIARFNKAASPVDRIRFIDYLPVLYLNGPGKTPTREQAATAAGESAASPVSSKPTSKRSRPTSRRTTGSSSAKRSGGKTG